MGINIASNFDVSTNLPLDSRETVADITARNAIPSGVRYIGLFCKVLNDGFGNQKLYWLVGGIANGNWQEFSSGGGGGGILSVADLTARNNIPSGERSEGMIVYVISEQKNYQLRGGITNAEWSEIASATIVSNTQALAAAGSIIRTGGRVERVKVQGTGGETSVTIAALPTPIDGDQLFIQGMSNSNPVLVGDFYLTAGQIGHLMYDAGSNSWLKVGGV